MRVILFTTGEKFLVINKLSDVPTQRWQISGNLIHRVDDVSQVLDIYTGNKAKGAKICQFKLHNGPNQLWHFKYRYEKPKLFIHLMQ